MLIHKQEVPAAAHAAEAAILEDDDLSYAARGLLVRILRNGPEWDINAEGLSELAKSARGAKGESVSMIRSHFREMEAAGYLVRARVRMGGRGYGSQLNFHDTRQQPKGVQAEPAAQHLIDQEGPLVYVIGQPGGSKVKIGQTTNMATRFSSYQTHSPVQLDILWTHSGSFVLEQIIHENFKAFRVHGEWFEFGDQDPVSAINAFVLTLDAEGIAAVEAEFRKRGVTAAFVWDPARKRA